MSLIFHVLTYNVAEKKYENADIGPLLGLDKSPDLISIGLEEVPDDSWETEFGSLLANKGYYLVGKDVLFYTRIRVYVLKKHIPYLTDIEIVKHPSGFNGGVRNILKGAIIVRFRLYNKSVAMLNCHMSAFMEMTLNRDTEYWAFLCDQDFSDPQAEELYYHDYIFWSGDLNYRIECDNDETRAAIKEGTYTDLIQYDQLKQQKDEGLAFVGFKEGDISFPPSYKFDIGTDIYDTSAKNRTPAWCDRVLWRVRADREIAANTVDWGELDETSSDSMSSQFSNDEIRSKKKTKKKRKKVKCDYEEPEDKRISMLRRRTLGLMRKTSVSTSSALLSEITKLSEQIPFQNIDLTNANEMKELLSKVESRTKESSLEQESVKVISYTSHPEYKCSDHKPVTATLQVLFPIESVKCRVKFDNDCLIWNKNKPLKVKMVHGSAAGDKICIMRAGWTCLGEELSSVKVGSGGVTKIPAQHYPEDTEHVQLVYYSEECSAPCGVVKVTCVNGERYGCFSFSTSRSSKYKADKKK